MRWIIMNNEEQFNKEEFAVLLDRAKGDRSINNFANETGVSAAHISRFLRQMIASPPTPETISKFAAKAHNEVTYQDLMVAAGHIARREINNNRESELEKNSPRYFMRLKKEFEKRFIQVLLANLYSRPFKWSVENTEERKRFPEMILNIDHEGYKRWYLTFKGVEDEKDFLPIMYFRHVYGMIAMTECLPTDKFSIVVNSKKAYDYLIANPPFSLRVNLYVMLIDLEQGEIIKEDLVCSYLMG
jgi:transcriptional regulator with XRE-family HTH domain